MTTFFPSSAYWSSWTNCCLSTACSGVQSAICDLMYLCRIISYINTYMHTRAGGSLPHTRPANILEEYLPLILWTLDVSSSNRSYSLVFRNRRGYYAHDVRSLLHYAILFTICVKRGLTVFPPAPGERLITSKLPWRQINIDHTQRSRVSIVGRLWLSCFGPLLHI